MPIGSRGPRIPYVDPLHHATSYFGRDITKEPFTNYFYCNGVQDWLTIQAAIDYTVTQGGGQCYGEGSPTDYDLGAVGVSIDQGVRLVGDSVRRVTFTGTANALVTCPADPFTYDISVEHIHIDCANAANYGIRFVADNATLVADTYMYWHKLKDVLVRRAAVAPIYIEATLGANTHSLWDYVRAPGATIRINRCFDSKFNNISTSGLDLESISSNHFHEWYLGGALDPNLLIHGGTAEYPNSGNIFTSLRSDNPSGECVDMQGYCVANVFTGCEFTNHMVGGAANTHSCFKMGANTHQTTVSGSFLGNPRATATTFRHLIEEVAGSTGNVFVGNRYDPNAVGTSILLLSDPMVSNYENRREEYEGKATSELPAAGTIYGPISCIYSANAVEATRDINFRRDGYFANFRVKVEVVPGVGNSRQFWVRTNRANDDLLVTIADAAFSAQNLGNFHIDVPEVGGMPVSVKTTAVVDPALSVANWSVEFYPDLEELV